MATRTKEIVTYQTDLDAYANRGDDELTQKRLDALLALNAETLREKSAFRSEREKTEAEMMTNPVSIKQAYAYFGLILGIFSPAAIFTRIFMNAGNFRFEDIWFLGVIAVINLISAIVGYFSGKLIGQIIFEMEQLSWSKMLFALPFIGMLWGIMAGGAGGAIVFVVGAFFGAFFGAAVGAAALPAFTIVHRLLKKGDAIDRRQFLPAAFGITFIVCAFILGL